MRSILCIVVFCLAVGSVLPAEELRDAPVAEIIKEAVPALTYVSGDKEWSGGFYTNGYIGRTEFDANTSYAIFHSQDATLSAPDIAVKIRTFLISRYNFPTTQPSSTWEKRTPPGMASTDFGEAVLVAFHPHNSRDEVGVYLSVEVVRRTATDFGITIQYTTLAKP